MLSKNASLNFWVGIIDLISFSQLTVHFRAFCWCVTVKNWMHEWMNDLFLNCLMTYFMQTVFWFRICFSCWEFNFEDMVLKDTTKYCNKWPDFRIYFQIPFSKLVKFEEIISNDSLRSHDCWEQFIWQINSFRNMIGWRKWVWHLCSKFMCFCVTSNLCEWDLPWIQCIHDLRNANNS